MMPLINNSKYSKKAVAGRLWVGIIPPKYLNNSMQSNLVPTLYYLEDMSLNDAMDEQEFSPEQPDLLVGATSK
jgi:hypothetical protein